MILFNDWKISCSESLLAMQYDHLSRQLQVKGDLPEGYDWQALVQTGDLFDIISLEIQEDGSLAACLTAQQLSQSGCYTVQLKGRKGETVRHTNQITGFVGGSLSGDEIWPEVPSAFTQLEQRVQEAARAAADSGTIASAASAEAVSAAAAAKEDAEWMERVCDSMAHLDSVDGTAALEILAESGLLTPAYADGTFYTDADGAVYIL